MVELFYESVHLYDAAPRAFGNAVFAATIEQRRIFALGWCHRLNDGFDADKGVVVDIDIFQGFAHARNHRGDIFQVAHLFYLLQLPHEIVEIEPIFGNFFGNSARFGFVVLLLCAFDERHNVAHAENAVGHALRVKQVDSLHLFARPDKFYRFVHHRANRKCRTAARVAIEFGEHHAVEIEAVVELFGGVHGILTRHRIDHKERFLRRNGFFDGFDFVHHLLVHRQASRRVDDNDVATIFFRLFYGVLRYFDGIFAVGFAIHWHANLLTHHAQLLDGRRAIDIAGHKQRIFAAFVLEHIGQFARKSGFARALQTRHQNDGGRAFGVDFDMFAAHELRQLVVYDFHHHLVGLHGEQHILTECFGFHLVGKGLGDLVVHIGIEQCLAHLFERFGNIYFGNFSLTFQYFERPFEAFA